MSKSKHTFADNATLYAQRVVDGVEPAGPLVVGACKKHLKELEMQGTDAFPFIWAPETLGRFTQFCFHLRHYKGKFAGKPIELMLWQQFIAGSILCWVHRETGLRRYRTAYVEIPRKNGKSAFAAAMALWFLMMDGESGSEVYVVATKKDQAKLVYNDALSFLPSVSRAKHLRTVGVETMHPASKSRMMPLGRDSKTLDGLNPHCGVADEIHEMKDGALIGVIENGMGARAQPLMLGITTAGNNKFGPAMTYHRAAEALAKDAGKRAFVLDTFFGYVACPSKLDEANWKDERVWRICNPGLGEIKSIEWMREQAEKAAAMPSALNDFLNKQLNIWTDSASRWIPSELWEAGTVPRAELLELCKGRACWGGLDLAKVTDLSALTLLFPPTETTGILSKWICLTWHWCPEAKAQVRNDHDLVPYLQWSRAGWLTLTEGNATDFVRVGKEVADICAMFQVHGIAFDRMFAGETVQRLQGEGVNMLEHGQGFLSMSPPTCEIERKMLAGLLAHDENPLMAWQIGNVTMEKDAAGNQKPSKERSRERIDGPVSLVMAQGAAMQEVAAPVPFSGDLVTLL